MSHLVCEIDLFNLYTLGRTNEFLCELLICDVVFCGGVCRGKSGSIKCKRKTMGCIIFVERSRRRELEKIRDFFAGRFDSCVLHSC
jgi:hypothetical protein